jgi:uncharacterized membrane protein YccC
MIRSALAICVPLGTAFAVGKTSIGLLPALGGLLGTMTDRGGSSYLNRVKRISAVGYGRNRNYGLLATFLTPLVVVLVDLLTPIGWRLSEERLADTLIGCAIVLVVGFAPWPMSWYAHLPGKFGQAALDVCDYMRDALGPAPVSAAPTVTRSRKLRATYRALGELRTEFQRTMSEPPSISRSRGGAGRGGGAFGPGAA